MKVTFTGISVVIEADNPVKAYEVLCDMLDGQSVGWLSDMYHTDKDPDDPRDTMDLIVQG